MSNTVQGLGSPTGVKRSSDRLAAWFTAAALATTAATLVAGLAGGSGFVLDAVSYLTCLLALLVMTAAGARVLTAGLLLAGLGLLFVADAPPVTMLGAVGTLREFLPIIVVTPIVGFLFQLRPYGPALLEVAGSRLRGDRSISAAAAIFSHLIGALAGLAALVVGYGLLGDIARRSPDHQRLVTTAIMRGYITTAVWTPASPAVALALFVTGSGPAAYLPWAVPFGLACVGLHLLFVPFTPIPARSDATADLAMPAAPPRLALEFAGLLALFLVLTIAGAEILDLSLLIVVPLVGLLLTLGVATLSGKLAPTWAWLVDYGTHRIAPKSNEIGLFLAAGVFLAGLRDSDLAATIGQFLTALAGGQEVLLLLALPVIILLLGLAGLPPNVGLVIAAGAIGPAALTFPPQIVALGLAAGVALTLILAPYTIPLFLMAGLTGRSTRAIGFGWNWRYGLALLLFTEVTLFVLTRFTA